MQEDNLRPLHNINTVATVWKYAILNINVARCCSYLDDVRDPFVTQAFDKSVNGIIQPWNQQGNLRTNVKYFLMF